MFKKFLSLILAAGMIISVSINAMAFTDVDENQDCYSAVTILSEEGVLTGYKDGSFKPDGNITRAEAATVIVRAAKLKTTDEKSIYKDVNEEHWAKKYIMAATKAGILSGMGNGKFAPGENVTYNQIIKMVVCMVGMENSATDNGGWPSGYSYVAYKNKIIDIAMYNELRRGQTGDKPATRADVAVIVYNAWEYIKKSTVSFADGDYRIGMSADVLGAADEILDSTGDFQWYVYGTDTYKDFYAVGVNDDRIVALASSGLGFEYNGYLSGDNVDLRDSAVKNLFKDGNDNNVIHGIFIVDQSYDASTVDDSFSDEELEGESKMNMHFVNGFRVYHGLKPLAWSVKAANSARSHSEDMAENDYFSHNGLNGSTPMNRMRNAGVKFSSCGENIAAGTNSYYGFNHYHNWVNSKGHRENILTKNYTYIGVGTAYNAASSYYFYCTQNFHG